MYQSGPAGRQSSAEETNPYETPDTEFNPLPGETPKPRPFRWRLIPAVLCWLIGGLGLLAISVWIANKLDTFQVDTNRETVWGFLDVTNFVLSVFFVAAASVAYLIAGFGWLNGDGSLLPFFPLCPTFA